MDWNEIIEKIKTVKLQEDIYYLNDDEDRFEKVIEIDETYLYTSFMCKEKFSHISRYDKNKVFKNLNKFFTLKPVF